jgi:ketosteroid isomerase-like protein
MTDNSNLRVVERAYAAFQNGDVPTLMAQFSDDVSWNLPAIENVRISGARTGKANLADFFSTLAKDQEALLFAPTGFVAEGDLVVALGRYRWRVKMTGREIASDFAHVFTVTHEHSPRRSNLKIGSLWDQLTGSLRVLCVLGGSIAVLRDLGDLCGSNGPCRVNEPRIPGIPGRTQIWTFRRSPSASGSGFAASCPTAC